MRFDHIFLGILVVWRITHLLNAEDGPWDVIVHLRHMAGEGFWGHLLDCFYCLSVWVAAPLAFFLGKKPEERILLWPGLSAGAILLERATDRGHGDPPAQHLEDSEVENVMLWSKKDTTHPINPS